MFRHTITFLLIFMVLNHDFAAARSIDFPLVSPFQNVRQSQPDISDLSGDLEWLDSESDTNEGFKTPAEIVKEVKRTVITDYQKSLIFRLDCFGFPHHVIPHIAGVTMSVVAQYLLLVKGKACPPGFRQTSSG